MITYYAYHRDPDLRHSVIARMAGFVTDCRLANGTQVSGGTVDFIGALADGAHDIAVAHHNTGFPAPMLYLAEAIFDGLAPEDAPCFAIALVRAANVDSELSDVSAIFLKWMFAEAVAELGPSRIRSTAREAGHVFARLAETGGQTPAERQKAKALAKQARRRGLELPSREEALVAQALDAALDRFDEHLGPAVHWIAGISPHPSERYRQFARKLLELVEAA